MKRIVLSLLILISGGGFAQALTAPTDALEVQLWNAFEQNTAVQAHQSEIQSLLYGQQGVQPTERQVELIRQICGFVGCTETYLLIETYASREGQANPMRESIVVLIETGVSGEAVHTEVLVPRPSPSSCEK